MPYLNNLMWLIALCAIGLGVWLIVRHRRRRFVIDIDGGKVIRAKGDVSDRYIQDVERMCDFWSIDAGRIIGTRRAKGRLRITVSRGISQQNRQAFQNAWDHPV